jgi:hypothetical protein
LHLQETRIQCIEWQDKVSNVCCDVRSASVEQFEQVDRTLDSFVECADVRESWPSNVVVQVDAIDLERCEKLNVWIWQPFSMQKRDGS